MSDTKKLNAENFQQETGKGVSLVDFYADWCGPCKALAPTIDDLSAKHSDSATIGKVNVDESQDLAKQFGVRSIPTVIALKDGQEVDRITGNVPLTELETLIQAAAAA